MTRNVTLLALIVVLLVIVPGRAAPEGEPLAGLFPEGKPVLVGPLAGIVLGETDCETTKKERPDLFEYSGGKLEAYPGVLFRATPMGIRYDTRADAVNEATVVMPKGAAEAALRAAWGEPAACRDPSGTKINGVELPGLFWFNEEKRLRAVLTSHRDVDILTYQRYWPESAFLGADGSATFGFEEKLPLLGATAEQFLEAYGRDAKIYPNGKSGKLWLVHPLDYSKFGIQVLLKIREGVITEYRLSVDYDHTEEAKAEWREKLTGKFGRFEEFEEYGQTHWLLSEDPRVTVMDQPGASGWSITVRQAEK